MTCRYCGAPLWFSRYLGWVDARGPMAGGNHDLCADNVPDLTHAPA